MVGLHIIDAVVPELRALGPDVIVVSGDHSTPSQMAAHSWHPVPTLLWSEHSGRDETDRYAFQSAVRMLGWDPDRLPAGVGLAR